MSEDIDERDWRTQRTLMLAQELRDEKRAVAKVRRRASSLAEAVDQNVWRWGDGHGGWLMLVVAEELRARGWDITPPRRGGPARGKAAIPAALRKQVYERDLYRCVQCGTHIDLSIDHIHPESLGGPTELDNLQTLCLPHNMAKGAKVS